MTFELRLPQSAGNLRVCLASAGKLCMSLPPKNPARGRVKLWLDIVLLGSFLLVSAPQATGVTVHEWFSFPFVVILLLHLLLNWDWIVRVSASFFKRLRGEIRFSYLWNALLFMVTTVAFSSGLAISEAALPALGLAVKADPFWLVIHKVSANLLFPLIGIHLVLHWRWIVETVRKRRSKSTNQATAAS
jgi:hypothetical protein